MKNYFLKNLYTINHNMAIHEGDANRRLASQAPQILYKLFPSEVPEEYQKMFMKLLDSVEKSINSLPRQGLFYPVRIDGIRNSTASKFIELLIDIEERLNS